MLTEPCFKPTDDRVMAIVMLVVSLEIRFLALSFSIRLLINDQSLTNNFLIAGTKHQQRTDDVRSSTVTRKAKMTS